jgi:signal peptidase I
MYSSYYDKEFILVDRFSALKIWDIKQPNFKRGDVVVLEPEVDISKKYFIKRIIGLPWEVLKIQDGNVFIKKKWSNNFIKLDEKYLNKENYWNTEVDHQRKENIYHIPEWKYFVMWDNRNHSSDSRSCFSMWCTWLRDNFIAEDKIIWKVLVDFGYLNIDLHFFDKNWNFNFQFNWIKFTHPVIKENWKYISTKPKWTNSVDSYNY